MFLILGGLSRTVSPTKRSGVRSLDRRPQTGTPDPSRWLEGGFGFVRQDGRRSEMSSFHHHHHQHDHLYNGRPQSACPCYRRHSFHVTQPASSKANIAPLSILSPTVSDSEESPGKHESRRERHHKCSTDSSIMDDKQENETTSEEAVAAALADAGDHHSASSSSSTSSSSSSSSSSSPSASRSGSPASARRSPTSPRSASKSPSRSQSSHHSKSRSSSSKSGSREHSGSRDIVRSHSGSHRSSPSSSRSSSRQHAPAENSTVAPAEASEIEHEPEKQPSRTSSRSSKKSAAEHSRSSSSASSPSRSTSRSSKRSADRAPSGEEAPVRSHTSSRSTSRSSKRSADRAPSGEEAHVRSHASSRSSSRSSKTPDQPRPDDEIQRHEYSQPSGACTVCSGSLTPDGICESCSFDNSYALLARASSPPKPVEEEAFTPSSESTSRSSPEQEKQEHPLEDDYLNVVAPTHDSFDAAEDEDKDVAEDSLERPETAQPASRTALHRQASGTISTPESLVREPSPIIASPIEGDGTPVPEYFSPKRPLPPSSADDERSFSFISADAHEHESEKVPQIDLRATSPSVSSSSSSSEADNKEHEELPGPHIIREETAEKALSDERERESESTTSHSAASSNTTPREGGEHHVGFAGAGDHEAGSKSSSSSSSTSSSADRQRVSSVELPPEMRGNQERDTVSDEEHAGESPIERPTNPHLSMHDARMPISTGQADVPTAITEEGHPAGAASPSGSTMSTSTLSSSAPVAAFLDKTNRFLEKALNSGGTASLVAERLLGVSALARSKEDITPTPNKQAIYIEASSTSTPSEASDVAELTPKLLYDSGYPSAIPVRQQPYMGYGGPPAPGYHNNYESASYLPTRSSYIPTSAQSRRFNQPQEVAPTSVSPPHHLYMSRPSYMPNLLIDEETEASDSMRDETASSTTAAAAVGERRASNEYTSYLKQGDRDQGDSGSSILDGPIEASSKLDFGPSASSQTPSTTSALQQIKRDGEQRERNIANWLSEARRIAPSSSITSDIEDLRERNQIFREALRCMSAVTSRELDELRNRSMRLDCEMIRLENDLRSVGFRLDSASTPIDDGQADLQQQEQQAPSYRSKYSAAPAQAPAPAPQQSNTKPYGGITNPSILEATMAVEALATKYFGSIGGIPTFNGNSKAGHAREREREKEQAAQQDYGDEPSQNEGGYVRTLLNRITELEHRVHELSETRTSAERRFGETPQPTSHMSRAAALNCSNVRGSSAQAPLRRVSPPRSTSRQRQPSADMWPVIRQLEDKLDMMTKKTLNEDEMFVIRDLLKRLREEKTIGSPRQQSAFSLPVASATLPRRTRSPSPLATSFSANKSSGLGGNTYPKRDLSAGGGRRMSPQRASSLADWLHQPSAATGLGESLMSQARATAAAHQQMRPSASATQIAASIRAQAIDRPTPACLVATGYPAPLAQATSVRGRSISPPQHQSRSILRTARLSPVMSGQRPSSPSQLLDSYSAISDDRPNSPYYGSLTGQSKYTTSAPAPAPLKADSLSTSGSQQQQSLNSSGFAIDSVAGKRPFVPRGANDVRLGDVIKFTRQGGRVARGVVRYVGHLPGREDVYLGVELEAQDGKHDGTYEGRRYFKCKPNKGVFVAFNKVVIAWGDA